jgi:thymidylate synthase (FAD)
MKTKLISYSRPIDVKTFDKDEVTNLISFCARVSAPDNQEDYESGKKLISYLVKHQHWSPLEMVSVCMEIETTRDIARQILRHRSFSFQEYSQRYANPTEDLEFVTREARLQDTKNRQNSIEVDDDKLQEEWDFKQKYLIEVAEKTYKWAIKKGIAKEQARCVLPEGNTVSRLYMNGTLRSWIHYMELRSAHGTQKEHMEIAKACAKVINEIFPVEIL